MKPIINPVVAARKCGKTDLVHAVFAEDKTFRQAYEEYLDAIMASAIEKAFLALKPEIDRIHLMQELLPEEDPNAPTQRKKRKM